MTRLLTTRRHRADCQQGMCTAEATVVATASATEIFGRCAPVASGTSKNCIRRQSEIAYEALAAMLDGLGAKLGNVVVEKAYLRHIGTDFNDFQQVREQAYRRQGVTGAWLPATNYLGQPPCRPGRDVELQVYAVLPAAADSVRVEPLSPAQEHGTVKMFQIGEARHVYMSNVIGAGIDGRPLSPFRPQCDRMFEIARETLRRQGIEFPDVVRTWIYLDDIDRDYGKLNASRNAFFEHRGVGRLPASTGIGAAMRSPGVWVSADVWALATPQIADVEVMTTPTLNEAPEYGSAFSRGIKVTLPEETYLFISGTASVDERGDTAHRGDVRAQMERMLLNVDELLRPHQATLADLSSAVTYLKSAEDAGLYRQLCAERSMVKVPHTMVQADVCRPELLCEMEAVAVLPREDERT